VRPDRKGPSARGHNLNLRNTSAAPSETNQMKVNGGPREVIIVRFEGNKRNITMIGGAQT